MDSFYRALITSVQKDPVGLTQSPPFLCILTIFIELLVSFFYIKLIKKPARILIWVIVANIISLPIVWFLIPWLLGLIFPGVTPVLLIIICELFAIFFEAYFLYITNKTSLPFKNAIFMSTLMNVSSFLLGLVFSLEIIP
jgi:hypothetical protein